MKALIWLLCFFLFCVIIQFFENIDAGTYAFLSLVCVFALAPILCRVWDRRQRRSLSGDPDSAIPAKGRLFRPEWVAAAFVIVALISSCADYFYNSGVDAGELSADRYAEQYFTDGMDIGYGIGYSDGQQADLEELTFYRNNAVLITLGGEKYHRWGCYHVSGRSYLIYNVELAELNGYTPCLDCWE